MTMQRRSNYLQYCHASQCTPGCALLPDGAQIVPMVVCHRRGAEGRRFAEEVSNRACPAPAKAFLHTAGDSSGSNARTDWRRVLPDAARRSSRGGITAPGAATAGCCDRGSAFEMLIAWPDAAIVVAVCLHASVKVVLEDHKVVALRLVFVQPVMRLQKAHQLWGGPVIAQLGRHHPLAQKHGFEELLAETIPLAPFVNVEVQRTYRLYLRKSILHVREARAGGRRRHEEALAADLQQAQRHMPIHQEVHALIPQVGSERHWFAQALGDSRGAAHFLEDGRQRTTAAR
mmetsp:Transcript_55366/g.159191  ORF Transcript_55366/g.159191 Transcript_55366/m.159191 type:complete len:288 (+) Transcript_55366:46-909(+)